MGFKFNVITGAFGGEPLIVRSLAEIEEGLKGVADPGVWNEEDGEGQGLLPLLRELVPTVPPPTWEVALAISVAFELGKAAVIGKVGPAALTKVKDAAEARRRGARNSRVELVKRAEEWKAVARRIMDADLGRSTGEKITKDICVELDKSRLTRSRRTVFNYVRERRGTTRKEAVGYSRAT
jgi:hypothetical protein